MRIAIEVGTYESPEVFYEHAQHAPKRVKVSYKSFLKVAKQPTLASRHKTASKGISSYGTEDYSVDSWILAASSRRLLLFIGSGYRLIYRSNIYR